MTDSMIMDQLWYHLKALSVVIFIFCFIISHGSFAPDFIATFSVHNCSKHDFPCAVFLGLFHCYMRFKLYHTMKKCFDFCRLLVDFYHFKAISLVIRVSRGSDLQLEVFQLIFLPLH